MNSDTKEQYFYMQNKRCKVVANDQCITIQNELQPNLQTVIKLTDLISIRLCTCRKIPTKLVCKCIQEKSDLEQKKFLNPTLTKNIINGNFDKEISFVQADSAFDSNEQFQLPRVDSTLSSESVNDNDEEFNEEEEIIEDECIDENENCIEIKKNNSIESNLQDDQIVELVCIDKKDENLNEINEIKNNNLKNEFKEQDINQKHITKVLIEGTNSRFIDNCEQNLITTNNNELINDLNNKENLSLESDDLNCSIDDDEFINQENLINNQIDNKRRVSILKELKDYHAQSTLMTSTSSGISTSSCNSTLNNKLKESSQNKILIRSIRLFYCVPYDSFNFKIKFINLIPEYLQDNFVITPEQIYNHNNEQFNRFKSTNSPIKTDYQFEFNNEINSSLNTLNTYNSLQLDQTDQQRINMINLLNATSQNRILEQKKIKQFVNFIKDYIQEFERPKSLLLFVNPIGGKKRAPVIYKKICQPLLSISSISYHTIFTQKANHAYELLRNEDVDLNYYQAIGCVGGDGMYSEILNGMLKRNKINSNSSSPMPVNEIIKQDSRRNSSATQKLKNKKSKQQAEYSDSSNDDENNKNERTSSGQSNKTTQSYQIKKSEILNQKRRQKLGVRYSLPNEKSNSIDTEELNLLRNGKRYSLPISPFKTKSIDLGSSRNLPLLIVPGGSTDAVSYAANGINDPQTVMCNFVLGKKINIDVAAIHTADEENRLIKFCSSFLGYGYFGDILKDSEENLRWMGPKRYNWAGLKKFFSHKVYKGELLLKVSLLDGDPKDNTLCLSNCQLCARSYIRNLFNITESNNCRKNSLQDKKDDEMNDENIEDDNQNDDLIIKNINKNKINLDRNKLSDDENTSIVCIKGRFLAINAATLSCRCGQSKYGISPSQHIGNGCCDLIVVAQCNRKDYLKYLFRTGFSEKSAFDLDFVNVYRVKEFTFTPILDSNQSNVSVWNVDGEILNQAAINVKVHCQLVSVFGSGLMVRPKNKQFVKREKLNNAIKLKLKNKDLKEENNLETNAKRYKTSFKKSINYEERRPSKVEFQLPQSNMIYQQKTIET